MYTILTAKVVIFTAASSFEDIHSGVARTFRLGSETENFPTKGNASIGISIVTVGRSDEEIFRQQLESFGGGSCPLLPFSYAPGYTYMAYRCQNQAWQIQRGGRDAFLTQHPRTYLSSGGMAAKENTFNPPQPPTMYS